MDILAGMAEMASSVKLGVLSSSGTKMRRASSSGEMEEKCDGKVIGVRVAL